MSETIPKTVKELVDARADAESTIKTAKLFVTAIDEQLAKLAEPAMNATLEKAGKTYGSLRITVDGEKLQGEIKRTVKWDSDALKLIADRLPEADAAVIFTVTLSISDESLAALEECEHPALGEILCARSVKLSPFSVKPVKA